MLSDSQKERLNAILAKQFKRVEPGTFCSRYSLMWEMSRTSDAREWQEVLDGIPWEEKLLPELSRYPGAKYGHESEDIVEMANTLWRFPKGHYRRYRRLRPGEEPNRPPASIRLFTGGLNWGSSIDVELLWGFGHAHYDYDRGYGERGLSAWRDIDRTEVESLLVAFRDSQVLQWDTYYKNPSVLDGEHWDVIVRYADGSAFKSEGSNNWPEGFDTLYSALRDLGMMRYGERGYMIESLWPDPARSSC